MFLQSHVQHQIKRSYKNEPIDLSFVPGEPTEVKNEEFGKALVESYPWKYTVIEQSDPEVPPVVPPVTPPEAPTTPIPSEPAVVESQATIDDAAKLEDKPTKEDLQNEAVFPIEALKALADKLEVQYAPNIGRATLADRLVTVIYPE